MIFKTTPLTGSFIVSLQKYSDARGIFGRAFCSKEFKANGLESHFTQANICVNTLAGTLRGMHFQSQPYAEVKLVRCIKGSIYDVIVDFREGSPSYLKWFGIELSEANSEMLYIPKGFAHGYQALSDGATVFYLVSTDYVPEAEGGLKYDDPKLGISWPLIVSNISDKDCQWNTL